MLPLEPFYHVRGVRYMAKQILLEKRKGNL